MVSTQPERTRSVRFAVPEARGAAHRQRHPFSLRQPGALLQDVEERRSAGETYAISLCVTSCRATSDLHRMGSANFLTPLSTGAGFLLPSSGKCAGIATSSGADAVSVAGPSSVAAFLFFRLFNCLWGGQRFRNGEPQSKIK